MIYSKEYINQIKKIATLEYNWSNIDNHTFFISGATGMLGSCLIDILMYRNQHFNANINIQALSRRIKNLNNRFCYYEQFDLLNFIEGDVLNKISIDCKIDYFIHAASNTHPKLYASDPVGTILTNINGLKNILDMARVSNSKRILFLSSVEVYGENRGDIEKFDESYLGYIDSNTLRAGYNESKRVSESLCQAYIEQYNLDIVIPRLARVFGPTMLLSDSKASSQFIMNAVKNEPIILKSSGKQLFSYLYVLDAASALIYLLINGKSGEAYNISNSEFDVTLKNLAETISEISGTKIIFDLPSERESKGFSKATKALLNNKKLLDLDWVPVFGLSESLNSTINILRD